MVTFSINALIPEKVSPNRDSLKVHISAMVKLEQEGEKNCAERCSLVRQTASNIRDQFLTATAAILMILFP